MIHVVIPAAGNGRRFVEAGYPPKPHVLVNGVPMLRRVVGNLRPAGEHRVTVVVTAAPPVLGDDVEVLHLDHPTSGAVETILAAGVEPGEQLLIGNCDQLLGFDVDDLIVRRTVSGREDGALATFDASSPAHSYVELDDDGFVSAIAEKRVISRRAVAGVYFFRDGAQFVDAAEVVLKGERRVLGEYYVSTVLDEMIQRGARLSTVHGNVDTLGTPEELEAYHARGRG